MKSVVIFISMGLTMVFVCPALGDVPDFVTYSGRLTDGTAWGQSTTLDLTIRVYASQNGDDLLWQKEYPGLAVEDGYFSVILTGVANVFGNHDQTWITACVGEGCSILDDLISRQQIGSVPYATRARVADTVRLSPGFVRNLGYFRSPTGIVSIKGADGEDLSDTNQGWVTVRSVNAPGALVTLAVTANVTFADSMNDSSNLKGWRFGVTSGVPWNAWMPVFIYVVNRDDSEEGLVFGLSRNPTYSDSPVSDSLGDKQAPAVSDDEAAMFLIGDVAEAEYAERPCVLLGTTAMAKMDADDDWKITGAGQRWGFGERAIQASEAMHWSMPSGQKGASSAATFLHSGTGQVPSWSMPGELSYRYTVERSGWVTITVSTASAGNCIKGSEPTGHGLFLVLPYKVSDFHINTGVPVGRLIIGTTYYILFLSPEPKMSLAGLFRATPTNYLQVMDQDMGAENDDIFVSSYRYKAF
jgi:hypothetical protein